MSPLLSFPSLNTNTFGGKPSIVTENLVLHMDVRAVNGWDFSTNEWYNFATEEVGGARNSTLITYDATEDALRFPDADGIGLTNTEISYVSGSSDGLATGTIEAWIKSDSTATTSGRTNDQRVIISYDRSAVFRFGIGLDALAGSDGKICFSFTGTNGTFDLQAPNCPDLRDDQWHQVGVAWSTTSIDYYLDGEIIGTTNGSYGVLGGHDDTETPRYAYIGNGSEATSPTGSIGPDDCFFGWYGGLRQYDNKKLNAGEIRQNFIANQIEYGIVNFYGNLPLTGLALHLDPGNTASYNGGSTINDISGNNLTGTVNGATLIDNYFFFDGANDTLTFPSNTLSRNGSAINIWFYVTDFTTSVSVPSRIVVRGSSGFNRMIAVYNGGFGYESNTNSNPTEMASDQNPAYPEADIVAGAWVNLIISWTNGVATVYINGENERTISNVTDDLQLEQIATGAGPDNYPDYFKGRIGNFMIYNRALTASEAETSYNALSPRYT